MYTKLKEMSHELTYTDQVLIRYVGELPKEELDTIQALILHHASLHSSNVLKTKKKQVPYQGTVFSGGVGVTYPLEHMPEELKKILLCYVQHVVELT